MNSKDLIGKTITSATTMKLVDCDDSGYLRLRFSDGTGCVVVATYDSYTGESVDEYPTRCYILDDSEVSSKTLVKTKDWRG